MVVIHTAKIKQENENNSDSKKSKETGKRPCFQKFPNYLMLVNSKHKIENEKQKNKTDNFFLN